MRKIFNGLNLVVLSVALATFGAVANWAVAKDKAPAPKSADEKVKDALSKLAAADRTLAESQRYCPVHADNRLGSMGTPVKVMLSGKPVFLCCEGCRKAAVSKPKETLEAAEKLKKANAAVAKLPAADRKLAEAQRFCPVMEDSRLGSMGVPVKVMIKDQPVFLCCKGCTDDAGADPVATLKKVEELKKAATDTEE